MRVSDYIIKFLEDRGVRTVFMVTGGQAMYLNDAVYQSRLIKPIFTHHEQAAGMAAEAYGRVSGHLGVAMVTAGPAAVNVLNGVVGAWVDSSPMLIISGQSALAAVEYMEKTGIRQYGLQGIFVKPIASPITKFFVTVDDPALIAYYLEKAYYLATSGRTGPVWLDVPLDIQRMEVPIRLIKHFEPPPSPSFPRLHEEVKKTVSMLRQSQRPLLLLGQGVHIAHGEVICDQVIKVLKIPVVTSRLALDLIDSRHPLFVGRPGLYGDRPANMAVQMADLILSVGARLDPGIVGYDAKDWGRLAQKVIVDLDLRELDKVTMHNVIKVQADAAIFLKELLSRLRSAHLLKVSAWIAKCQSLVKHYSTVKQEYSRENPVNSYFLTDRLSALASPTDTLVVDTSSPFHVVCQAWKIKKGQRLLTTGGISTMGYWPAAIGACLARGSRRTIVVTGDGCLQMNLQELATVKHNKLPIKIFIINNNGYLLIRHTQKLHMEGRLMGESPASGLWCPDSIKIAAAYGIRSVKINSTRGIDTKIKEALEGNDPVVCDVLSPQWQLIIPRISSERKSDGSLVSHPYEDMFPFLPRPEFKEVMTVPDITAPKRKTRRSRRIKVGGDTMYN